MYSNFARVYDSLMESVDRKAWLEYIISLFGDAKIERVADCLRHGRAEHTACKAGI